MNPKPGGHGPTLEEKPNGGGNSPWRESHLGNNGNAGRREGTSKSAHWRALVLHGEGDLQGLELVEGGIRIEDLVALPLDVSVPCVQITEPRLLQSPGAAIAKRHEDASGFGKVFQGPPGGIREGLMLLS